MQIETRHVLLLIVVALLIAVTTLAMTQGNAWSLLSSDVTTGTTSSASGLEIYTGNGNNELSMLRGCSDEDVIKFDDGSGVWSCQADSTTAITGAGATVLDLGDDGADESSGITEIATTGDTNSIFTEPSADKLLIDLGLNWPSADTAVALFADPSDCGANTFAITIAANGNLTCASITDADVPNTITIDLATSATNLAADPADCGAGTFADAIDAQGDLTCNAVTTGDITDGTILPADLDDGADTPGDEECLTYESTGTIFEWQACGSAQNLWETINASSGTDPVADSATDTLNMTGGTGITVTGDSATDTITIATTIVDTGPSPDCAGTNTYQDGEGNCDTLDGLEDFETATDDALVVGNGSTFDSKVVPDCDDSGGQHINYDTTGNAFSCGTSGDGVGYDTVQYLGSGLTQRSTVNMTGSAVACSDTGSITECTFTGGSTNAFNTWDMPQGEDIVADSSSDTVTFSSPNSTVAMTGTAASDTFDIDVLDSPAINGTGVVGQAADDQLLLGSAASEAGWVAMPDCDSALDFEVIHYTAPTNTFACGSLPPPNSFETWDVPVGTDPVADSETDTITLTSPNGTVSITGAAPDIVGFDVDPTAFDDTSWGSDSGGFSWTFLIGGVLDPIIAFADGLITLVTDLLLDNEQELRFGENDANGSNYIAVKAPAAVTSNQTCELEDDATPFDSCVTANPADQNLFETIDAPLGTDPVADTTTDTLQLTSTTSTVSITGSAAGDSLDFDAVDVNCSNCLTTTEVSGLDISDDTNLAAGRSLTLSGDSVEADAELYTDTSCIWFEDPTAVDDFQSIWRNSTANALTITEIWAESDQTVNFDLQIDDGTPADVNGTDISPAAGEAEDTTLSGDTTLDVDEELDLAITSVSGTPTWVSICWTYTWNE